MWIIAYVVERRGWCLVNLETRDIVAGPFANIEEAEESARTRAFRLAQGWSP